MISSTKFEHGVLVDPILDKFNIFLAQHAKEYSHFISLQSKKLRKTFCNTHPLYKAEHAISSNYYAARKNIDDPYSEYLQRRNLLRTLKLYISNSNSLKQ